MITNSHKTSLLIPSQLPEFIRDNPDYEKFVTFLQAYYEWMEQEGGLSDNVQNILNYRDIDRTSSQFLDYFVNTFLQYFPKDALVDKATAVKAAKQLYQSKGTKASYEFLFRILYNSSFDVFYTKDVVFKASAGTWFVPRSLRLLTTSSNFLNISQYKLFGEDSKSYALVENSIVVGDKIQVFISSIERQFHSGEFVRLIDRNNQDVLVNGSTVRAKIVGQIGSITVNPNYKGLQYQPGDPVVISGGLASATSNSAIAHVGTTTAGSITGINVLTGGYGYRENPNTLINIENAPSAYANVATLDPAYGQLATYIVKDVISLKVLKTIGSANYAFSNIALSNANTSMINAFSFASFNTNPISSIIVGYGGSGISTLPKVTADSRYATEDANTVGHIVDLGILGPILISSGGKGYQANDVIIFTGGRGLGARANVTTVNATGAITTISYIANSKPYPLGGMGYSRTNLPTLSVASANANASGAILTVGGILGDGATFATTTDKIGQILTIVVDDAGQDYTSQPNVSLRIHDVVVSNLISSSAISKGDVAYQGSTVGTSSYLSTIDSVSFLAAGANAATNLYRLRLFDYNSKPSSSLKIRVSGKNINLNMLGTPYDSTYDSTGVRTYGDGTAKATAEFLNGVVLGQGNYVDIVGHPSAYSILQSENFNNYTYEITVQKEIAKYRDILLNLVHPSGAKLLGKYALSSEMNVYPHAQQGFKHGHSLQYFTGYPASYVTMSTTVADKSTNTITFNTLAGANVVNFLGIGNTISISSPYGPNITSVITSANAVSNTATIKDSIFLTYINVAYATANSGTNTINILSLTGTYDQVNNGQYRDPTYKLKDIIQVGDRVALYGTNPFNYVSSVDYINNKIYCVGNFTSAAGNASSTPVTLNIRKTLSTTGVKVYNNAGIQYIPELATEAGISITTEADETLLLG
jgi:hypothetical protein